MALILRDRVKETTTTTGTGTITLAGAVAGFQSFSVIGNANTTYYAIVGGTEFEVGVGTYTSSGTTLSRDTVLTSSNSGNKVDFSAGEKDVFCTQPADKTVVKDSDSGDISIGDNLNINFGAGSDLNLLHNNSYGNIIDTNDKVLNMICGTGGTVSVNNGVFSSGFKAAAIFDPDGAQSIRYDGVTKFATTSSGAKIFLPRLARGTFYLPRPFRAYALERSTQGKDMVMNLEFGDSSEKRRISKKSTSQYAEMLNHLNYYLLR